MADHRLTVPVSFGHCDPAGIVFYPNFYSWFDRCFHDFLHVRGGGHARLCTVLESAGIGLMESDARFHAPVRENEVLELEMTVAEWRSRSLLLVYEGRVGQRLCVTGHERRGVFVMREGRMGAGEVAPLRTALGLGDDG